MKDIFNSDIVKNTNLNIVQILKGNCKNPDTYWGVTEKNKKNFYEKVIKGKQIANNKNLNIVCLARNCQKQILNSIKLIQKINKYFLKTNVFIYENDSVDGTKQVLSKFSNNFYIFSTNHNTPYLIGKEVERTKNLAEYRNHCVDWVKKHHSNSDYTIVLDLDADGGFYVDGILNSVYWLENLEDAGGVGSYSLLFGLYKNIIKIKHYDNFAARVKWEDNDTKWFNDWFPQTGSDPILMKSCFGGLAIYKNKAYLNGKYEGSDCEHIGFHKSLEECGWKMYFNPSSLFGSVIAMDQRTNFDIKKLCIKN
jgi:hypothetical protein